MTEIVVTVTFASRCLEMSVMSTGIHVDMSCHGVGMMVVSVLVAPHYT